MHAVCLKSEKVNALGRIIRKFFACIAYYFLHSYYFECHDEKDILATTHYGDVFHCAVNKGNIFGFQFHPEKSHFNGINLFKNFAEL